MTAASRFIVLVIVLVGAAAAVLAPRTREQLAVLQDEEMYAQIISLLEPRLAAGDKDSSLLAALGHAYGKVGNHPKAIELLRRYAAVRPNDAGVYAELAEFLFQTGDLDGAVAMLNRSIALDPKPSRITRLAALYRQLEQPDAERALLARFEPLLDVSDGSVLRLAQLEAESGARDAAIRTLMLPQITLSAGTRATEERIVLAGLLVEGGRSSEAVRLATRWAVEWNEAWLSGRLLQTIAIRAPAVDADELADVVVSLHPEIRLFLAHQLGAAGARPVALHLLERWGAANPRPSSIDIAAFLSACIEQGDPAILWRAYAASLRAPAPTDVLVRLTQALAAQFGIEALAPFWPSLPPDVIQQAPILAAQLAFNASDLETTRRLLDRVDLLTADETSRAIWFELLRAVASPDEQFRVLRTRQSGGRLPATVRAAYLRAVGATP